MGPPGLGMQLHQAPAPPPPQHPVAGQGRAAAGVWGGCRRRSDGIVRGAVVLLLRAPQLQHGLLAGEQERALADGHSRAQGQRSAGPQTLQLALQQSEGELILLPQSRQGGGDICTGRRGGHHVDHRPRCQQGGDPPPPGPRPALYRHMDQSPFFDACPSIFGGRRKYDGLSVRRGRHTLSAILIGCSGDVNEKVAAHSGGIGRSGAAAAPPGGRRGRPGGTGPVWRNGDTLSVPLFCGDLPTAPVGGGGDAGPRVRTGYGAVISSAGGLRPAAAGGTVGRVSQRSQSCRRVVRPRPGLPAGGGAAAGLL